MTVTNTVTETEHLTPLRSAVEHINWNTLYQQKMALEEVSDMLYAKRKEDDTFGKASAWLESVIALMERLGDAAEEEGFFRSCSATISEFGSRIAPVTILLNFVFMLLPPIKVPSLTQ